VEAHTGYLDDDNCISEVAANNNLDLAINTPEFDGEKQNYKKVKDWTKKEKYKGQKINDDQIIVRNSKEYQEFDFDFMKYMSVKQAQQIINIIPETLTFGRGAAGHALYKVTNTPDDAKTIRIYFKDHCINELRTDGSYSIFYGPLDKEARAEVANRPIAEIDYQKLKKLFRYQNILAALTMLIGSNNTGEMNSLLLAIGGEFYNQEIPEETTVKIINKWHSIIDREDRIKESEACIRGIYKSKKASNIFSKIHFVPIDEKSKHQFRQIVKDLIEKKEEFKAPKTLTSYCLNDYMQLNIKPPIFIVEKLFKENSINFISGPKGNGKTEYVLGLSHSLCRGQPFLDYTCPDPMPVVYIDGEMDPYDLIERSEKYIERLGPTQNNYFTIVNFAQQLNETIPDIKSEIGQQLITDVLEKVYKLTGKKAVLILDNLRSLSNYKENDSDEYRLINSWMLRLRGQCYTSIVIDHHGKAGVGPRGTSSKTDNANVSILINAVKEKGCPDMVMKVEFDKARGLRPDETEEYEEVYAFNGSWIKQTARKNKNEIDDNHMLEAIYLLKKKEEQEHYARCYTIRTQLEKNEINQSEYNKAEKKLRNFKTQKDLAEFLNISAGKVNQLMQKYRDYLSQKEIAEKTSNY
jgi:RecA-family ATPase